MYIYYTISVLCINVYLYISRYEKSNVIQYITDAYGVSVRVYYTENIRSYMLDICTWCSRKQKYDIVEYENKLGTTPSRGRARIIFLFASTSNQVEVRYFRF